MDERTFDATQSLQSDLETLRGSVSRQTLDTNFTVSSPPPPKPKHGKRRPPPPRKGGKVPRKGGKVPRKMQM